MTYVSRHKNRFIKSGQIVPGRRPPVIEFQNEIMKMDVRRVGVEAGRETRRGRRFVRWVGGKSDHISNSKIKTKYKQSF